MTITCDEEARRAIADAIEAAVEHAQAAAQEERSQDGAEYFADMVQDWVELARVIGDEDLAKSAENTWEELQQLAMELEEEAEEELEEDEGDDEHEAAEQGPAGVELDDAERGGFGHPASASAMDFSEALRRSLKESRKRKHEAGRCKPRDNHKESGNVG
jgi:hypothetical protein